MLCGSVESKIIRASSTLDFVNFAFDSPHSGCHNIRVRDHIGGTDMPLQNHLTELERKHRALEREIQDTLNRPSADDMRLAELKRRKLQLKDEISRLRSSESAVH
jgi:hypothetical protein